MYTDLHTMMERWFINPRLCEHGYHPTAMLCQMDVFGVAYSSMLMSTWPVDRFITEGINNLVHYE